MRWAVLRPMPGTSDSAHEVVGGDRLPERSRRMDRQHRLRQPRADAGRSLQQLEHDALVVVGKAIQSKGILAYDERRRQPRGSPTRTFAIVPGAQMSWTPKPPTSTTTESDR